MSLHSTERVPYEDKGGAPDVYMGRCRAGVPLHGWVTKGVRRAKEVDAGWEGELFCKILRTHSVPWLKAGGDVLSSSLLRS